MSRMVAATVPMPSTNKELAVLIRDVVGARPKYGDESARPAYWPEDVPWKKGKSISQVSVVRVDGWPFHLTISDSSMRGATLEYLE